MNEKESGKDTRAGTAGDKGKAADKPAAAPAASASGGKAGPSATVRGLFLKSKTKPYLLEAFCLFAKTAPGQTMSESEFEKNLKNYLKHQLK